MEEKFEAYQSSELWRNRGPEMKTKHTPIPWEILSGEVVKQGYGPHGNIAIIAKADRTVGNGTSAVERDENMAFIVKAVNSHDELLEALYMALPYVETAMQDIGYKPGIIERKVKQIKDAIAKAERSNNP